SAWPAPAPVRAAAAHRISYRPRTEDDRAFIEALYGSTREEELRLSGWPDDFKRQFVAQQQFAQSRHLEMVHPGAEWLIVERDDARIGRLYLGRWDDEVRVIDISLVPAARGQGIGSAIFADILSAAGEQGCKVSIHVEWTNPARRLYQRLGFATVEDGGIYLRMERRPDQKKIAS
ncbi:MAG: GNAT family N-acetyltransferase, partial [Allosphingosinicella sp.]